MPSSKRGPTKAHEWTPFELNIVLALICKGEHTRLNSLQFATKVNEALNGNSVGAYDNDIPVGDVEDLLRAVEKNKKGALAFIERQPHPHVLTRTKRRVFERNLPFDGSLAEWVGGRREEVRRMKEMMPRGTQQTFTNAQGVQIERWVPQDSDEAGNSAMPAQTDTWTAGDRFIDWTNKPPVPSFSNGIEGVGSINRSQGTPRYSIDAPPTPTCHLGNLPGGWGPPTPVPSVAPYVASPAVSSNYPLPTAPSFSAAPWRHDKSKTDNITSSISQPLQPQPLTGGWGRPAVSVPDTPGITGGKQANQQSFYSGGWGYPVGIPTAGQPESQESSYSGSLWGQPATSIPIAPGTSDGQQENKQPSYRAGWGYPTNTAGPGQENRRPEAPQPSPAPPGVDAKQFKSM
ncbi:hypothetical protein BJ170DRAFT_682209 [Xylariales sp. AK1849]|nr:hypothetical protein BJ170DRAFT_682209 [Xylariales sp. AK1849]